MRISECFPAGKLTVNVAMITALQVQQQTLGIDSSALKDSKQLVRVELVHVCPMLVWNQSLTPTTRM